METTTQPAKIDDQVVDQRIEEVKRHLNQNCMHVKFSTKVKPGKDGKILAIHVDNRQDVATLIESIQTLGFKPECFSRRKFEFAMTTFEKTTVHFPAMNGIPVNGEYLAQLREECDKILRGKGHSVVAKIQHGVIFLPTEHMAKRVKGAIGNADPKKIVLLGILQQNGMEIARDGRKIWIRKSSETQSTVLENVNGNGTTAKVNSEVNHDNADNATSAETSSTGDSATSEITKKENLRPSSERPISDRVLFKDYVAGKAGLKGTAAGKVSTANGQAYFEFRFKANADRFIAVLESVGCPFEKYLKEENQPRLYHRKFKISELIISEFVEKLKLREVASNTHVTAAVASATPAVVEQPKTKATEQFVIHRSVEISSEGSTATLERQFKLSADEVTQMVRGIPAEHLFNEVFRRGTDFLTQIVDDLRKRGLLKETKETVVANDTFQKMILLVHSEYVKTFSLKFVDNDLKQFDQNDLIKDILSEALARLASKKE